MIDFIEKTLKILCLCIGIVVLGTVSFCALCGDFGITPLRIVLITLAVVAFLSFIDIFKGLNKAKETPLFRDED